VNLRASAAKILYTAAHGGFSKQAVPLGGGAAVFDHLMEEWSRTRPFDLHAITPSILQTHAPTGRDLVRFSERDYAAFCRRFERAATNEILRHDPATTVVLSNDVSEGPDFALLAARGYRIFTIFHVDVVAYVAAIYARNLIRPETTVRWYRRLRGVLPDMAELVWAKQESSVLHSRGLIVPSEGMRDTLARCYPGCREKIHVLPWGSWDSDEPYDPAPLRAEFNIPTDAQILLTLSRISPEKGQDRLLEALLDWEKQASFPDRPPWVFICGDAAFMQGRRFLARLRKLAARLCRTRVIFPGHVTGARKRAFFALADLYIFPSRHESYGLTLMEALAAGLPAVCIDHDGARAVMRESFGELVEPGQLRHAIAKLLADPERRRQMSEAARAYARTERFTDRAAQLAAILTTWAR
jgi:glycosyltransferase involved in cell wall biosynthesis